MRMNGRLIVRVGLILSVALGAVPALAARWYVDDGDGGYAELTGTWGAWGGDPSDYNDDIRFVSAAGGGSARWSFASLPPGRFMVYASWTTGGGRPVAVTYTLSGGIGVLPRTINQQTFADADMSLEDTATGTDAGNGAYFARLSPTCFRLNYGTLAATLSAPSGTLIADAVRLESVRPDAAKVYVIDNESCNGNNGAYTENAGTWAMWAGDSFDHRDGYRYGSAAGDAATFAFTGLDNGRYRVSATWQGQVNRPNDAAYALSGYPSRTMNQQVTPVDDWFENVPWNRIFPCALVTGGALSVQVVNPAGGSGNALIADAVRAEKLWNIVDNGDAGFLQMAGTWGQDAGANSVVDREELWSNSGGAQVRYTFTGIPSDQFFMVYASWIPGANRTDGALYTLSDGYGDIATVNQVSSGWIRHDYTEEVAGSDSGDVMLWARVANPVFHVVDGTLDVTVTLAGSQYLMADAIRLEPVRPQTEAVYVIDNENPSANSGTYAETVGSWATYAVDARDHRADYRFSNTAGAKCQFAFTGIPIGRYRVSAAWVPGASRPTGAVYAVAGGPAATVNQVNAPADDFFEDVLWKDLFTVIVGSSGTLTVELSNATTDAVIADAVRLEKLPAAGTAFILK